MALTASNIQRNHRGVYFEFTGDGSSTTVNVPHGAFRRSRTATAKVITGGSNTDRHSGCGGFLFPASGTTVNATAAVNSDGTVTLTTGSAVGNAVKAVAIVIFDDEADA